MTAVWCRSPQVGAQGNCVDQGHHRLILNSCLPKPARQKTRGRQVSGNVWLGCSPSSGEFVAHLMPCSLLKEGSIFCSTRTLFLSTFHPKCHEKTNHFPVGIVRNDATQLRGWLCFFSPETLRFLVLSGSSVSCSTSRNGTSHRFAA